MKIEIRFTTSDGRDARIAVMEENGGVGYRAWANDELVWAAEPGPLLGHERFISCMGNIGLTEAVDEWVYEAAIAIKAGMVEGTIPIDMIEYLNEKADEIKEERSA